jgi:hypothetical protein
MGDRVSGAHAGPKVGVREYRQDAMVGPVVKLGEYPAGRKP